MNIYSKVLENQKILDLLNEDQKKCIKKFEMEDYKLNITFKDFYFQLVNEAKEYYVTSEYIQQIDCDYNARHLSVCEIFEPLDLIEWENDEDSESYFKWSDCIYDMLDNDIIDSLKVDFKLYFETVQYSEV